MLDSMPRFLRLFTQYLFIERHHNHVVKVEAKAGVRQHADNVGEVIQLVFRKELVMQVEAAEDHVHLRHVIVVVAIERVVQNRDVWPRGIQQSQILETAGAVDVGKETVKELQVAFAIEDHHRNFVALAKRSDAADEVLRNDVAQQSGFSGS